MISNLSLWNAWMNLAAYEPILLGPYPSPNFKLCSIYYTEDTLCFFTVTLPVSGTLFQTLVLVFNWRFSVSEMATHFLNSIPEIKKSLNFQRLQHMFTNFLQHKEDITNVINVLSKLGSSDESSKQKSMANSAYKS